MNSYYKPLWKWTICATLASIFCHVHNYIFSESVCCPSTRPSNRRVRLNKRTEHILSVTILTLSYIINSVQPKIGRMLFLFRCFYSLIFTASSASFSPSWQNKRPLQAWQRKRLVQHTSCAVIFEAILKMHFCLPLKERLMSSSP